MRQLRNATWAAALSLICVLPGCTEVSDTDSGPGTDGGPGGDAGPGRDAGPGTDSGPRMDGGGGSCSGPATGDCNVFDPTTCAVGMACVLTGSTMAGWMTQCIAAGVGRTGTACDPTMQGQCEEGWQCTDGTCSAICCTNSDCTTGDFCGMIGGANAGFCQTPADCDLIAQTGCAAMSGCYPGSAGLQCADAGMFGEGATCVYVNDCTPGMGCISPAAGGESECRAWCNMMVTDPPPCPAGYSCTGVTGLPVGACTPNP